MLTEEVAEKSALIAERVLSVINWDSINKLHIYSPITAWNEVDTRPIKKVVTTKWPHIEITSPAPVKNQPFPADKFDLIIVPVLGFDKDMYRLGYGGGWYDRFLASQKQARTIGLAYNFSKVEHLPHEVHDIPLQKIVTETDIAD